MNHTPTAAFATFGCKVNQYETQRILDTFEDRGFQITEITAPADVYVINTCSVTRTAENKSRRMIHRLAKQNPNAVLVMTGCYGEMLNLRNETLEEATMVVPNQQKMETLNHLLRAYPHLAPTDEQAALRKNNTSRARRTRATIKIQDGCDVYCSYCSIPYTRSVMASRPAEEILNEVHGLAGEGYREIVITGVLVGSYGASTGSGGPNLAGLLRQLTLVEGVERIRLSSIEPTQVNDELLVAFSEEPKLCNHLHIPLQSGDSGILKSMNRPYTRDDYLRLCEKLHKRLPGLAITTDILVGFPGEDRFAFRNTLALAREAGFARAHIFRYSPRPGTPATEMQPQVSEEEKDSRSHELAQVCRETQQIYIERYIGQTLGVLVESREREDGLLSGYTENYIRASFIGGAHLVGRVVPVRILEFTTDGAVGEARDSYQPEADIIPLTLARGAVQES